MAVTADSSTLLGMPLSGRLWAAYSSVVGAAMQLFDARAAPGCPCVLPPTLLPAMGRWAGDVPPQPCVRPSRRSDDGRLCCWQVARQLFLARGYAAPARRSGPNDGGIDCAYGCGKETTWTQVVSTFEGGTNGMASLITDNTKGTKEDPGRYGTDLLLWVR